MAAKVPETSLEQYPVIIAIAAMPDCPACEAYVPRFLQSVEARKKAGIPYKIYSLGMHLPDDRMIPVLLLDATSEHPEIVKFMDRWAVEATPTTFVILRSGGSIRVEGSVGQDKINAILALAEMHA